MGQEVWWTPEELSPCKTRPPSCGTSFRRGNGYVGGNVISLNTLYKLCSNGVFYL